uniref:C-type lectin domain-containing protein n=1 Tax=Plectus sambesii TaxID=2011161 RepID=A0A914WLM7_9BILA
METEKLLSTIEAEQPCEAIDYVTIPTVQLEQLSTTAGQEVLPLINQSSNSTPAFPTLQDSSDDDDWLCFEPTLSCYKVFFELVTWLEAETKCRNNGTQLISIHSEQENEIIAGLIQGQKTSNASEDHTWIGLRITDNGENWTWSDGSGVDFLNWADGEPNNMLLDLEDNLPRELEHCVQLIVSDIEHFSDENNRHWNNYVCESTAPVFVCKKPFSRTE